MPHPTPVDSNPGYIERRDAHTMYKNVESEDLILAHLLTTLSKISVSLSFYISKTEIAIVLTGLSEAYTISG